MKLIDYIEKYHKGNKTAFGLSNGIAPSQVGRYLDYECLVVDGQLLKPIKELKK